MLWGTGIGQLFFSIRKQHTVNTVQGYRGMEVSIFEVLFFLTLLVYTAPHIMVFGAVLQSFPCCLPCFFCILLIASSSSTEMFFQGKKLSISYLKDLK